MFQILKWLTINILIICRAGFFSVCIQKLKFYEKLSHEPNIIDKIRVGFDQHSHSDLASTI